MSEKVDRSSLPDRFALGLDSYLDRFAATHFAKTWKQASKVDPDHWKIDVLSALNDPDTEVFFNLRDVEIGKGLLRAASGRGGATDWELLIIQQNPAWWTRIRWFDGDQPVSNPFDFENGESIHELRV